MIDFSFTDEQKMLAQSVREHIEAEIAPNYMQINADAESGALKPRPSLWVRHKLAEWGLLGFGIDEKYGGQGVDCDISNVTLGLLEYELGRGHIGLSGGLTAAYNMGKLIDKLGSDYLKELILPAHNRGDAYVTGMFTEATGGTDLADIKTTAYEDPDDPDYLIVNGLKSSVSNCDAEFLVTLARMVPNTELHKGVGVVVIQQYDENGKQVPGLRTVPYGDWGGKTNVRGDVFLTNVRVPKKNILQAPGKGIQEIFHFFDNVRPTLGLMCVGCADRVMEKCEEYCKQRMSFGKPLAKYEAISFGLAEHHTHLEAAKLFGLKAFSMRDKGEWNAKEAAMCKWYGCEGAFNAIWFCTRAFGHLAYTPEYDVVCKMLDVMGFAWGDGGYEAQKIVIIREFAGREFLPYDRTKKQ